MSESDQKQDEPIPGPAPCNLPDYPFEPQWDKYKSPAVIVSRFFADLFRKPAYWIRENIVEPNRGPKYYWYHKKFGKALPIDECYIDDRACMYEADLEYKRTRIVDKQVLELLRYRRDNCDVWYFSTRDVEYMSDYCKELSDTFDREELNFFTKYGDLHGKATVLQAFNKQKHRMIMERRLALKKQQLQQQEKEQQQQQQQAENYQENEQ